MFFFKLLRNQIVIYKILLQRRKRLKVPLKHSDKGQFVHTPKKTHVPFSTLSSLEIEGYITSYIYIYTGSIEFSTSQRKTKGAVTSYNKKELTQHGQIVGPCKKKVDWKQQSSCKNKPDLIS